ncbi:MAG: DivIVA domain-containing protein [Oscillospiraceae bacterium]|nr:DivIVA domain-containing protein [Oscillospiraceae bacterium]
MLTPQEIQEVTFAKAVFGGYDMEMVDNFVEPLTEDYLTLYNENAVLKNKLKVLVAKLEEYRDANEAAKRLEEETKKEMEVLRAQTEEECKKLLADAERKAAERNSEGKIAEETMRLDCAKQLALNFIEVVQKDIEGHLELLDNLRGRDLSREAMPSAKAMPFIVPETEEAPVEEEKEDPAKAIAEEIEESLNKLGVTTEAEVKTAPATLSPKGVDDRPTAKFNNLMFGKNYDPMGGK